MRLDIWKYVLEKKCRAAKSWEFLRTGTAYNFVVITG